MKINIFVNNMYQNEQNRLANKKWHLREVKAYFKIGVKTGYFGSKLSLNSEKGYFSIEKCPDFSQMQFFCLQADFADFEMSCQRRLKFSFYKRNFTNRSFLKKLRFFVQKRANQEGVRNANTPLPAFACLDLEVNMRIMKTKKNYHINHTYFNIQTR